MKNIVLFLFLSVLSASLHAMPDFSLSQGTQTGQVIVDPNDPNPPFFLTEIWRLGPGAGWQKVGTTYQGYRYTDNVTQSGTYSYRTRWYNPQSQNPWSMFSSFSAVRSITITIASAPSFAPSLSVPSTETNDGTFTVNWGSVAGATYYQLQRRTNNASWIQIYSGALRSRTQTLANGQYSYRVRACNSFGCSGYSVIRSINVNVTNTAPPPAPAQIYIPSGAPVVVWTEVPSAAYYELRTDSSSSGNVYSGPNVYYYLGFPPSQTRWRVRACSSSGSCSGWRRNY